MRGLRLSFGSCFLSCFLAMSCQSSEDLTGGEGGEGDLGGIGGAGEAEGGAGGEAEGGAGGAEMDGSGGAGTGGAAGMGGMMAAADANCPGKGMKVKVAAGQSVAAALMAAKGGETIELADGNHGDVSLAGGNFPCETVLRAENKHQAQLANLTISDTKNLHLADLKTSGTVALENSASLKIANFQMATDKNCLRIKNGQDITIEGNSCKITDNFSYAFFIIGNVKKTVITRNLIQGGPYERGTFFAEGEPGPGGAIAIRGITAASRPDGMVISNNIVRSFWNGMMFAHTNNIDVVNNTFIEMTIAFWDQSKEGTVPNVIVVKNERLRLWNNVMHAGNTVYTIWLWLVGHRDEHNATNKLPAPLLHSHNAVAKIEARQGNLGGSGASPITGMLNLDESWKPRAGSPLIGAGLKNADTPTVDFAGKPRGDKPSVGALEP